MATVTSSPYPARLPGRAHHCLAIGLFLLYLLAAAGNAAAGNPLDDGGATVPPTEASQQSATTGQTATANGVASQSEPINVVVSVRVNSPGNHGPVSQSNVTVVSVGSGNDSGTTQSGADGQPQQAATGQDATATGQGSQSHPINLVVSVRINSPGKDGPVSQANVVVVGVDAGNASNTTQSGSAGGKNTPKTAVPLQHALRHTAAPAEAADVRAAAHGRKSAPRRSAQAPGGAGGPAAKSPGRPVSGAAAAHSAGFPAAAARVSSAKRVGSPPAGNTGAIARVVAKVLRSFGSALPVPPRADRPADVSGQAPLTLAPLTVIALLGALLVSALSTWLGGLSRPVRAGWGRRR
jgi:hypothetical protein